MVRPAVYANELQRTITTDINTQMRKGWKMKQFRINRTEIRAGGINNNTFRKISPTPSREKNPVCEKPFPEKKWLDKNPTKKQLTQTEHAHTCKSPACSGNTNNTFISLWLALGHPFSATSVTELKENNTDNFPTYTGRVVGNSTTCNRSHALALE